MKALFAVGLILLILGVASLFVPIPQKDRHGVEIGDVSRSESRPRAARRSRRSSAAR